MKEHLLLEVRIRIEDYHHNNLIRPNHLLVHPAMLAFIDARTIEDWKLMVRTSTEVDVKEVGIY
jgi:hypothetical protein